MAADEVLLDCATRPTLRLYHWQGPWLSLGYAQNWNRPLPDQVRSVRRPSGGRAVLHDGDLTYAIVLPDSRGTVGEVYRELMGLWFRTFTALGLEVEAAQVNGRFGSNPNCYAALQIGEISWQGQKLIGSAQLRRGQRLLQHGSIPQHPDVGRFQQVFPDATAPVGVGELDVDSLCQHFPYSLSPEPWSVSERAAIESKVQESLCHR